jgi:ribosomal RNA-processing protein 12
MWISLLFQCFSSASAQEITKAYEKVSTLFRNNLANTAPVTSEIKGDKEAGKVTTATQDILILLLPYLSPSASSTLFDLCLTADVIGGKDNGVQKRGYKILTKLVESNKVVVDAETTLRQLDELVANLTPAAKKASDMDLTLVPASPDYATGSIYPFSFARTLDLFISFTCYPISDSRGSARNKGTFRKSQKCCF